jgi:4-hydroxy-2-oxoheptanedioate aldolase
MKSVVFLRQLSNMASAMKKQLQGPGLVAFQLLGEPLLTEHYAKGGFNAVVVDMQHGISSERTAFDCVQRLEKFPDCFPIIRVSDNNPGLIQRALDAGALGIIAPMINTPAQAEALVRSCRYPPLGERSWGPSRALAVSDPTEANQAVKVIAMIETREAIDNVEAIMDVEGIDGAFIGPCDLSISLGEPPQGTPTAQHVIDAINKTRDACKSRGKLGMIFVGDKHRAQAALEEGWAFAAPGADVFWVQQLVADITDIPIMKKNKE